MFDSYLRNIKDRVGEPIARQVKFLSPNLVSVLGVLVALLSAYLAVRQIYFWGLAFWLLSRALDGLDGLLARLYSKQSDFGGYLDIILDFVAYAAVPLGFGLGAASQNVYVALAVLLSSFYLNSASWMYLAAILEKRAARDSETLTTIVMPAGLIGALESITIYSLFFVLPQYIFWIFIIFSALVFITVIQRLIWAYKTL